MFSHEYWQCCAHPHKIAIQTNICVSLLFTFGPNQFRILSNRFSQQLTAQVEEQTVNDSNKKKWKEWLIVFISSFSVTFSDALHPPLPSNTTGLSCCTDGCSTQTFLPNDLVKHILCTRKLCFRITLKNIFWLYPSVWFSVYVPHTWFRYSCLPL